MPTVTGDYIWETVGIPLVKGVDLNTRTRLVSPDNLIKAENVYFPRKGGPEKRRGHTGYTVVDDFDTANYGDPPPSSQNMYGWGIYDTATNGLQPKAQSDVTGGTRSAYPHSGDIKEVMTRDDEVLAWDGWRLFSHLRDGRSKKLTAYLPSYTSKGIAKIANTINYSDAADNGVIRVVAYVKFTGTPSAEIKVYDSVTGALKFTSTNPQDTGDVAYVRVVNCGAFVNVLISDVSSEIVYSVAIHEDDDSVTSINEVTACGGGGVFDFWKYDETKFIIASINIGNQLVCTWVNANGTVNTTTIGQSTVMAITGTPINVAVAVHPVTQHIGLFWDSGATQYYRVYDAQAVAMFAAVTVNSNSDPLHLAIVPSYMITTANISIFSIYYDGRVGGTGSRSVVLKRYSSNSLLSTTTRYNVTLASKGCRVGNVPFIWTVFKSVYQTTYMLMDNGLLPVAKVEYGTAKENLSDISWLPSINYITGVTQWQTTQFHGALLYNQRIDIETPGTGTTFAETSTKFYSLDFLPKLSWSQAGRSLYIAGGQLWVYDGDSLYEDNFHIGPEELIIAPSNGTGSLTVSGVYKWRVDLCHKNAFGEEVRSVSFLVPSTTPFGGADDTATLTMINAPTRRTNAYYLVFRNENNGTAWYLVSNRDPQSAPSAALTTATTDFIDLLADTAIISKEQHPANNSGYLQPISAPACNVISYGRDRLWIGGGELQPGEIWPSRLFFTGQVPSWSFALGIQVDRGDDLVTAIAFQSDYTLVFKRNSTYIVSGPISSNIFSLTTPFVQLALADKGCINHKSVVRLSSGVAFQSSSGYRLMGPSGGIENIGFPVDSKSGECVGAILVNEDEHLRFYQSDNDTLVLDYGDGLWSTFVFNNKPSSAVLSPTTGMAIISTGNKLLFESNDEYTDNGFNFYYTIRTAPLGKSLGGYQKIRRIFCVGEKEGTPPPVIIRIYTDTKDYYDQQISWDYSVDGLTHGYGNNNYGDGLLGDASTSYIIRDSIWRWRRRIKKPKCESISIELTDVGLMTNVNKWIPVAFALEIGTKPGLDRTGPKTFTER